MTLYDLRVTVERIEGRSVCGLAVGDYFELTESSRVRIPEGKHFCLYALQAVLPLLPAKQRQLPESDWLEQDSLVACPDPDERVIMRIERVGQSDAPDRRPHVSSQRRELGLALQTDKPVGAYAALARRAEDAGFDVVTAFNDLWFQPALPALLEIAAATERVRVGPSCLNPFTLHPVELAGQVAALDRASGGRAFLGLAHGAWLETLGVDTSRSLTAIREAWEIVRRLLAGDDSGFAGDALLGRARATACATRSFAARCRCSSARGLRGSQRSRASRRPS